MALANEVSDICLDEVRDKVEECAQRCNEIIDQARQVIDQQTYESHLQDRLVKDLMESREALYAKNQELMAGEDKWYNNPYVVFGLGIAAGGSAAIIFGSK